MLRATPLAACAKVTQQCRNSFSFATSALPDAFHQVLHFGETPRIPGVAFDARGYVRSRCVVLGIEPPPEPAPLASAPRSTDLI